MTWVANWKTGEVTVVGPYEPSFMQPKVSVTVKEGGGKSGAGKPPSKFKWQHVKDRMSAGRMRALKIAGANVRRSTQRAMSNRKPIKDRLIDLGVVKGQRLIARRQKNAIPDRVTSWKTARFPKGFLRSDIQYDYDTASDSVVIGPTRLPKLNRLHEVGGQVRLWFVRTRPPASVPRRLSGGAVFGVLSNKPAGRDPVEIGRRRVRARRYMETGLDNARPKIAESFRDSISGP